MTTFISDSRVLAIPYLVLAPNHLMLVVVTSPHGSVTALAGAATLSQAHFIQPGRTLRAEPQVRSSFREFLQLHMQLRVAPHSSTPKTLIGGGVGKGLERRKRKTVEALHAIPCCPAHAGTRLPASLFSEFSEARS
jgi:hypothetical protein